MEKISIDKIRKIIIGTNPKDGMAIEVGHTYNTPKGEIIITQILRDENNFHYFGNIRYLFYAKKTDGVEFVWKSAENVTCIIESFIPKG